MFVPTIGVARGGAKESWPPKFLEKIVILCFERRFFKQSSVIRQKWNILSPQMFWHPPNFWTGYATGTHADILKHSLSRTEKFEEYQTYFMITGQGVVGTCYDSLNCRRKQ